MNQAADTLRTARRLIELEHEWGQGDGDKGHKLPERGRCSAMALGEARDIHSPEHDAALRVLLSLLPPSPTPGRPVGALVEFNDTHTHGEVLALFDRAIEAAGG